MKPAAFVVAVLLLASPAYAQLGGILNKAQKAKKAADTVADLKINDQEEREIGEQISTRLRETFGVVQDAAVTKYVSLVGGVLAQQGTRPNLNWTFIVLDTDAVNAFAAPGGIVHVTRGLLGLCRNEAELAGVLGHEITHITERHTVDAIQQNKVISGLGDQAGGGSARKALLARATEWGFHQVLDGQFSQKDENQSDEIGVRLASKLGYSPAGLVDVLKKLDARNAAREERNGLFASHPATKDRIEKLERQIKSEKLPGTATVQARYAENIKYEAKPITEIAMNVEGAAGLAGGGKTTDKKPEETAKKQDDAKTDQPKKRGGLLSRLSGSSSGEQKQSTQTVASAGARGVETPDRDAKGGPNKTPVPVKVTAADLTAFKKGITA